MDLHVHTSTPYVPGAGDVKAKLFCSLSNHQQVVCPSLGFRFGKITFILSGKKSGIGISDIWERRKTSVMLFLDRIIGMTVGEVMKTVH